MHSTVTVCDGCMATEGVEPVEGTSWTYCPKCKADWLGYKKGRRDQAIAQFGHSIDAALEQGLTHYQLRQALELQLDGTEEPLEDELREAK